MTELLFYEKPTPLAKDKHKTWRYKRTNDYGFASAINTVPVAGHEFFHCSRDFPVMFVETSAGSFLPVALLALTNRSHQLGDRWEGVYVPAFIKRYPFALAENQDVVMIDERAPHFQAPDGDPLFDEEGEPSLVLRDTLEYLDVLNKGHVQTLEYMRALKVKGLLSRCKSTVKLLDREIKLDSFFVVNEREFQEALTDEEVVDWFNRGWIGWTYAHIHSIGSV